MFNITKQCHSFGGKSIPDLVVKLVERDRTTEMQLSAARVLTNLHRANALTADDPKILYKTLPCLVSKESISLIFTDKQVEINKIMFKNAI